MAVFTDPEDYEGQSVVLAFSDAPSNEKALEEINDWARNHGFVRSREFQLNVRRTPDGRTLYYCACYRLTEEDTRAAQDDLSRIRKRREEMPLTTSSDRLLRQED